jgi:hypothetical protein
MVDPSARGIPLVDLTILASMLAGAVAGSVTGWLARRNVLLSICTFMIGIMGGMLMGTGMGRLIYGRADGYDLPPIKAGCSALCSTSVAGLAGSIPTAFVIAVLVGFLTLRHLHPRPPRVRTCLIGFTAGVLMGVLGAMVMTVV